MLKAIVLVTEQVTMIAICLILRGETVSTVYPCQEMDFIPYSHDIAVRGGYYMQVNEWKKYPATYLLLGAHDADFYLSISF